MSKICNIIFWIENDPPLFGTFPKIHPFWYRQPSLRRIDTSASFEQQKGNLSLLFKTLKKSILNITETRAEEKYKDRAWEYFSAVYILATTTQRGMAMSSLGLQCALCRVTIIPDIDTGLYSAENCRSRVWNSRFPQK